MRLRKALVNDIVHSFCYACRTQQARYEPINVILGARPFQLPKRKLDMAEFFPFMQYAGLRCKHYLTATQQVVVVKMRLEELSVEECAYAISLMKKYYGCTTDAREYQSHVPGNQQQELPNSTAVLECH